MATAAIGIGLGAVGTGVSIAGQIQQGNARADAARRDAELKELQAEEILQRSDTAARLAEKEGAEFLGQQKLAAAASGRGVPFELLAETHMKIKASERAIRSEAVFRANQLRRGAELDEILAKDFQTQSILSAVGTGFRGVARTISLIDPKRSTQDLFDNPGVETD